jgi:hypothetical protein
MTGPEHWNEADLILSGECCGYGCPHVGCVHEMAYLARAQVHATLAAAAEGTRCLAAIRSLLAAFNWETDDRQLALEAIERIADGDQP